MSLIDQVNKNLSDAMRTKAADRLSPLRMLKAALVNRRIEKGHNLSDAEAQQVVASLIKQRRDSISQFSAAGRDDLAEKERAELAILEAYQPPAVDAAELERIVEAAIAETGATSAKDIGRVMKAAMAKLAGRTVDGRAVNDLARSKLA